MTRLQFAIARVLALCGLLGFVASGTGCQSTIAMGDAVATSDVDESGKIPTKHFMGNHLFSHVTISPSGNRIAVMISREGTDALIAIDLISGEKTGLAKLERRDSSHSTASNEIERVGWASDNYVVLSAIRPLIFRGVRARRTVLFSSDLRKPRLTEIGNVAGQVFADRVISYLPNEPERLLVSVRGRAQRLDLKANRLRKMEFERTGVSGWIADHEFKVRIGHSSDYFNTELGVWGRVSENDRLERLVRWDPYDKDEQGDGFFFVGFSDKPEIIYVRSERETGRFAIYEYDVNEKKLGRLILGDDKYDVGFGMLQPYYDAEIPDVWTSRVDGRLLSISYLTDVRTTRYFDDEHRRLWAPVHREFEGKQISVISIDRSDRKSVFTVSADDTPPVYYTMDHQTGEYLRLFRAMPALEGRTFSKTDSIQFKSRDGLTIHGYVTRPVNAYGPTATIVLIHDQAFGRVYRGWNSQVQFFASRGFTVFQVNHRGSSGYGREFREAGYQEFGRAMQDDITDGVQWLIDKGIADSARIGIFGIGYGGYAALRGLTSTPDLYAAGASYAGISDLVTLLNDDTVYWGLSAFNKVLIGSRWTDRSHLNAVSPALHADQIKVPVLLGHGSDDWRNNIRHTDKMAAALKEEGVEHEVHRYRGESHDFIDERTRIAFYLKLGDFFERHLSPDPAHIRPPISTN